MDIISWGIVYIYFSFRLLFYWNDSVDIDLMVIVRLVVFGCNDYNVIIGYLR